jgi:hypothetical protein
MSNVVVLNQPIPAIAIVGAESDASVSGSVTLSCPISRLAVSVATVGTVAFYWNLPALQTQDLQPTALRMPVPVLLATGYAGLVANVPLRLPAPTLVSTGVTGTTGVVALVMPTPQLSVVAPNMAGLSAPVAQLSATGYAGLVGTVSLQATAPSLAVTATIPFTGTVALSSMPQMAVNGTTGSVARTAMTLRSLALAVQGYSGTVGTASMSLPIMKLSISGELLITGSVALSLPMLVLQATGGNSAGVNALTSTTIAMHTESNALTSYTNYKFNSFAAFNGVYLGANDNGIYALSGATDDGAVINAAAQVGLTDFGSSHLKRIDRCYVGYRTDGNMVLRVFTDETTSRDYLLTATGKTGLHGNHLRIGKGLAARYWQFEILNQNGADFQLDMVELKPTVLRRRVGGRDA